MFRLVACCVLGTGLAALPLTAPGATSLGQNTAPAGLRLIDGSAGGRILTGPLTAVHSPAEAFRRGLVSGAAYFGRPLRVGGAVRSTDGTLTVGLFRTTLATQPVAGLALVTYGEHGGSRVAFVFDRPGHLHTSLHPLLTKLAAITPARTSAGATPPAPLRPRIAPDGSVHVLLPADWKIGVFAQGEFAATGPSGEEVDQELTAQLSDPRSAIRMPGLPMPYMNDPTAAFVALANALAAAQHEPPPNVTIDHSRPAGEHDGMRVSQILGTMTVKGVRNRFNGFVATTTPGGAGGWSIVIKQISAPVDRFAAALPTLTAIYDSYNVDQGVRHDQVLETERSNIAGAQNIRNALAQTDARNTAVFNASMSHARAVQDGIDRSTAGFTHYLNDTDVVEHTPSGRRATVDYNFASAIVQNDPRDFRTVPVSEYQRGVDY